MSPEEPMADAEPADEPEAESGGDDYRMAGRTIRHALSDGDDEAIADAICKLIDIHTSAEPEGDEPPAAGEKPNLAMLLLKRKK